MQNIIAALRLFGFVGLSLTAMGFQSIILATRLPGKNRVPHLYFRLVANLLAMRVNIDGEKPQNGPGLILANHASWLDIVAMSAALPVVFVAKKEVRQWPFFGTLASLGGTIFIDRDRRQATGQARNYMQSLMKQGARIVLFPEGTTSDGNRVLPFRSALLGAAADESAKNSIIPALIAYSGRYGLPMSRADRNIYAWFGDMTLLGHLWRVVKSGPFDVTLRFYPAIAMENGRKIACNVAENLLRQELAKALSGRLISPVSHGTNLR